MWPRMWQRDTFSFRRRLGLLCEKPHHTSHSRQHARQLGPLLLFCSASGHHQFAQLSMVRGVSWQLGPAQKERVNPRCLVPQKRSSNDGVFFPSCVKPLTRCLCTRQLQEPKAPVIHIIWGGNRGVFLPKNRARWMLLWTNCSVQLSSEVQHIYPAINVCGCIAVH